MKIHNTVPYFLSNFTPTEHFINQYHEKYATHFKEYFLYHCKNVDEKKKIAIEKYPEQLNDIKLSNSKIEKIIKQVLLCYKQKYDFDFQKEVHIIVGLYGSNAYTHRQFIPDVTFCLERLSSKDEHLNVIIAHEFGHALHNFLSDQAEINWSKINWNDPLVWLLQEGCATYFSKQVTIAEESVYFSYGYFDREKDWLKFAQDNLTNILTTFIKDYKGQSPTEIFREWFSINGGKHFGYMRLGYYIGYIVVNRLIEKYGVRNAVTLWKEANFSNVIEEILLELVSVEV
ncbi:DUF5700 domain-containing putative Zn-dependent protease [Ornithinibacillus halotolerans]|uniref:Aminopeptidase n=1 Tax=Ornithinibacillus halotolerans TaxID=1274357 RepID=A0A916SC21_9BACI|nr:DUF5700 domain-containing putative Zn-dependent protease [Ornithinibacillus halotolerans]GGA90676.1 hypothetical protein GCM10008025_36510 [Ornithinibacillus halotolerans]